MIRMPRLPLPKPPVPPPGFLGWSKVPLDHPDRARLARWSESVRAAEELERKDLRFEVARSIMLLLSILGLAVLFAIVLFAWWPR